MPTVAPDARGRLFKLFVAAATGAFGAGALVATKLVRPLTFVNATEPFVLVIPEMLVDMPLVFVIPEMLVSPFVKLILLLLVMLMLVFVPALVGKAFDPTIVAPPP